MTDLKPDKDGNIVLIRFTSFGPLEYYEWGINAENQPYERYQWCEDDFYEDSNYCITISKEKLLKEIDRHIEFLSKGGFDEEATKYREIKKWVESRLSFKGFIE